MWRIPNFKDPDTHTSKTLTKIILGRIEKKIDENRAEDQFDNTGKRGAILYLQNIVEESFTVNRKVYVYCLCRFTESFDNVNWNAMMKILKMIKTDYRERRIIRGLYKHQTTSIKIKENKREAAIRRTEEKTEVMVCSKDPKNIYIKTNEDVLTQVPKFKYISSILTEDGKNKGDIIQQIRDAKVISYFELKKATTLFEQP